jgi:hypothetical protein
MDFISSGDSTDFIFVILVDSTGIVSNFQTVLHEFASQIMQSAHQVYVLIDCVRLIPISAGFLLHTVVSFWQLSMSTWFSCGGLLGDDVFSSSLFFLLGAQ